MAKKSGIGRLVFIAQYAIPLVLVIASNPLSEEPTPPVSVPLPAGAIAWKLLFNDEFDGAAYDTSKWNPYADWSGNGSFNNGREKYSTSQIKLSNGICNLIAQPDPKATEFTGSYKSGELISARANTSSSTPYKFDFLYGYVEARLKIVEKPGFFTAYWMLPSKKDYNYEWEIDILEQLGGQNKTMFQTYHYTPGLANGVARNTSWTPNDGLNNNGKAPVLDYSKDFHTVGVDWQPDHLTFYIDGIASGSFPNKGSDNSNIARTRGYILIQQMVENSWCRSWDLLAADSTKTADTLQIDYVRVWQGTNKKMGMPGATPEKTVHLAPSTIHGQVNFSTISGYAVPSTVTIYDESSRLVRRISGRQLTWDWTDRTGRPVPPGLYFYALNCGGSIQTGKVMRLR